MTQPLPLSMAPIVSRRAWPLLMLLAAAGTGCYRATGMARPTLVATEIPASGGDRVGGLKATATVGDVFLGNDFVSLAVDGATWQNREGQFQAPSGGAILDIGAIALDQNFKRVSVPSDLVDRLAPVLNQDPDLPLVFDAISPVTEGDNSRIEMRGGVVDAAGKLGLPVDSNNRVIGLEVAHTISLALRGRNFELTTTLTNHTGTPVPIFSIGDFLDQRGAAGYRVVAPGQQSSGIAQVAGSPTVAAAAVSLVHDWGVEIPGSDFDRPLGTSVRAMGVGFQGAESAGEYVDSHMSLGIMSADASRPQILVASDPQSVLNEPRPRAVARVVAGRVPDFDAGGVPLPIASGASLSHTRRLYLIGGASVGGSRPTITADVFNQMYLDRYAISSQSYGAIGFSTFGTAAESGSLQTEVRFERYLAPAVFDPVADANDSSRWMTERVEYFERGEALTGNSMHVSVLPAIPEVSVDPTRKDRSQVFRMVVRNREEGANTPFLNFTNSHSSRRTSLLDYLEPRFGNPFLIEEPLAPERNNAPYVVDGAGNEIGFRRVNRMFVSRDFSGDATVRQPMRVMVAGLDLAGNLDSVNDPNLLRTRHWSTIFYPIGLQRTAGDFSFAGVNFRAGNEAFGTGFPGSPSDTTLAARFELPLDHSYRAFAIRGPLASLQTRDFSTAPVGEPYLASFLFENKKGPAGWISFDVPGPSLATGGGMHPMEQMAGALAEDVKVIGRTEIDRNISGPTTYAGFRGEFVDYPHFVSQLAPVGEDPIVVGGRSSALADGSVTALFPPDPSVTGYPGLRPSKGWTLADFLNQAEGQFNVIHRPLGPGGLFSVKGYSLTDALGVGANAWWDDSGSLSGGKRMGDFDALELLRGESLASQTPAQWHQEYKQLRALWFKLIAAQSPTFFTKALGLSSGNFSFDTPVGLARTYLKVPTTPTETDLTGVLAALKSGAAVASTGPMLEVDVNGTAGPGQLLSGTNATVTLNIAVTAPEWVPVEQVKVYVNGALVQTLDPATFTVDPTDDRRRSIAVSGLALSQDSCIVVEAGTPDVGPTVGSAPWNALYPVWFKLQRNIYPIVISNPVFVLRNGGSYTPPRN